MYDFNVAINKAPSMESCDERQLLTDKQAAGERSSSSKERVEEAEERKNKINTDWNLQSPEGKKTTLAMLQ